MIRAAKDSISSIRAPTALSTSTACPDVDTQTGSHAGRRGFSTQYFLKVEGITQIVAGPATPLPSSRGRRYRRVRNLANETAHKMSSERATLNQGLARSLTNFEGRAWTSRSGTGGILCSEWYPDDLIAVQRGERLQVRLKQAQEQVFKLNLLTILDESRATC